MDGLQQISLLLIEPHQLLRRIMRDILRDIGIGSVTTVPTVHQAVDILPITRFDAVFVDWSSATDALTFLNAVRRPDGPAPFLPVIVLSSFADGEHVRHARDAGATDYLLKPFSPATVMARVNALMADRRPFVAGGSFFGPDRRHHANGWQGPERRRGSSYVERRTRNLPVPGIERRRRGIGPAFKALTAFASMGEGTATRH
ncbi:MAG: response regulator transcription factor [Solirubrobacterales bacterium]